MKGYGERLSPSPIYYIIVIVKKGQPCVAQVIFVIHSNSDPKPPSIWRAHISGRGGGGCRVGRRTTKQYMIHARRLRLIPSSALR